MTLKALFNIMANFHCLLLLFFFLVTAATSQSQAAIVNTLPGYTGTLPFSLETGYVGVGENEDAQYFYYFIESQRNASEDPLLLWITGNSCSSLHALLYENGPIFFKYGEWDEMLDLPKLFNNPYTWTKNLSVIFLDAPVGSGFSYSKLGENASSSDPIYASRAYEFLQKWLIAHSQFLSNQIYLGGDGYTGMIVPLIIQQAMEGIDNGTALVNFTITGYVLGNPGADNAIDFNSRIPFGNRLGFIPDELFESANTNCNGSFIDVDPSNTQCVEDAAECNELLDNLNFGNVLEAACGGDSQTPSPSSRRYLEENFEDFLSLQQSTITPIYFPVWCRKTFDGYADTWANDERVQDALHVRKGTVATWTNCKANDTYPYPYEHTVDSVVYLHKIFTDFTGLRSLIFCGDHDLDLPYIGTIQWIKSLNLPLVDKWRAWSVDNETAGYTRGYEIKNFKNENYTMTFATVKGAGHFAAQDKVKECSAMIDRWMSHQPL